MKRIQPFKSKFKVCTALIICIYLLAITGGCGNKDGIKIETNKPAANPTQIDQNIIFIREFYYSGENSKGVFIEKDGSVKSFDFTTQTNNMESVDLIQTLDSNVYDTIATVDVDDLYYYYNLLCQVSEDSEISYIENINDVVLGFNMVYGILLQTDGSFKYIQISGSGDAEIINQDDNAILIDEWLQKVLP